MTIHTTAGVAISLPRGCYLTTAREALRRLGYRLTTGPRGRLLAERLH